MQVIPAVDVLDGKVVRLLRGSFSDVTVYGRRPGGRGRRLDRRGAELVHLVDLEGARIGSPDPSLWPGFAAAGVPFQVGGGIRDVPQPRAALESGAARVVLGTAAVWKPEVLAEIGNPEKVVAAVDVADGEALGDGLVGRGAEPRSRGLAGLRAEQTCARMLVTSIIKGRDHGGSGPGVDRARSGGWRPEMALIASGGVGSSPDLQIAGRCGL